MQILMFTEFPESEGGDKFHKNRDDAGGKRKKKVTKKKKKNKANVKKRAEGSNSDGGVNRGVDMTPISVGKGKG